MYVLPLSLTLASLIRAKTDYLRLLSPFQDNIAAHRVDDYLVTATSTLREYTEALLLKRWIDVVPYPRPAAGWAGVDPELMFRGSDGFNRFMYRFRR